MSKKIIRTSVLLLLLVVLPAVSWLYLSSGLDYRLTNLERLSPKSQAMDSLGIYRPGRLQVIYGSRDASERVRPIMETFSDQDSVLVLIVLDQSVSQSTLDVFSDVWSKSGYQADISEGVFLTDFQNRIIQCYRLNKDEDMARLSKDIAFLLPLEPEKDFEFKREKEK